MNTAGVEGDVVVDNLYDAVEAVEAKLGVTGSAVTTSHDYKLSGVTGTDKAVSKTGEETLTTKTLTTPVIPSIYQDAAKTKLMTLPNTANDTLTANAATQTLTNKTLTNPTSTTGTFTTPRINTPQFNEAVNMTATSTEVNTNIGSNAAEKVLNTQCKVRAYLTSDQTNLTDNSSILVNLAGENYDIGSDFNTTTYLFTTPVAGYYLIVGNIQYYSIIANKTYRAAIKYDGGQVFYSATASGGDTLQELGVPIASIYYCAASKTIGLYAHVQTGANTVDIANGSAKTYLSIYLLSV